LCSSGLWRCAVLYVATNVLEELIASIYHEHGVGKFRNICNHVQV
jgi:hypothetical protein